MGWVVTPTRNRQKAFHGRQRPEKAPKNSALASSDIVKGSQIWRLFFFFTLLFVTSRKNAYSFRLKKEPPALKKKHKNYLERTLRCGSC